MVKENQTEEEKQWFATHLDQDGAPLILRIRSGFPDDFKRDQLPQVLSIQWEFEPPVEHGLPDTETRQKMEAFEDALTQQFLTTPDVIMTMVVTCRGVHEWQFYTVNAEDTVKLINEILNTKDPLPLQLSAAKDPDWNAYYQWVDTLANLADEDEQSP